MIYRELAERYGWLPEQVNRLTLPQAAHLLGEDEAEDGGDPMAKMLALSMFGAPTARQRRQFARRLRKHLGAKQ